MAAASSGPDSFELADYLGVLRRRWWIVLVLVVIGASAGVGYTKLAPKTYAAAVLAQVNPLPNNANAVAGRTSGNVNMDNEAQIVQSIKVAMLASQRFPNNLTLQDLVKRIAVSVPANTTFLQIKCSESSASLAAQCANAFGTAYLNNRRATAASAISSELSGLTSRINSLATKVTSLRTQLASLSNTSPDHTRTQLNLTAAQNEVNELQRDSNQLVPFLDNLNLPNNTAVGQVATPATPPTSPASPRALLVLPSGLLAGLLLGLLGAFFTDFRDRRIHAARDVERFLDLPVLVNMSAGKARMQAALAAPRSRVGQAFTELGQYVAASLGEGSHVVFVAGTSTGSGCSVVAANLAATLARTRSEVVLVCADPHGTITPKLLGVSDGRGLAEILSGTGTAAELARRPAGEKRLRVITPGMDASGALLQLQYEASRRLLNELRHESHYVIVEVQSVGEDSAAFALAEFADVAIMSVETSLTTRSAAAECLQRLDRLRTSVLGSVVLPAPDRKSPDRKAADRQAAERPVPGRAEADRQLPDRPADRSGADRSAPDRSALDRSGSERPASSRSASARAAAAGQPASQVPGQNPWPDEIWRSPSSAVAPATVPPVATGGKSSRGAAGRTDSPGHASSSGRSGSAPRTGSSGHAASSGHLAPSHSSAPGHTSAASPRTGSGSSATGGAAKRPGASPARPLTETRPMPRVTGAGPADQDDPVSFADPADKIAGS